MDKEVKLSVRITSAVFDTFEGKVNINCTVQLMESAVFNDGSETGHKLNRGDSTFATLYLDKTLPPGADPNAESAYQRTLRTIKFAGGKIVNGTIIGPFPNALIGVFDMNAKGKVRCHYLNTPLTATAKSPPSKAMLAALFGNTTDDTSGTPGEGSGDEIPF